MGRRFRQGGLARGSLTGSLGLVALLASWLATASPGRAATPLACPGQPCGTATSPSPGLPASAISPAPSPSPRPAGPASVASPTPAADRSAAPPPPRRAAPTPTPAPSRSSGAPPPAGIVDDPALAGPPARSDPEPATSLDRSYLRHFEIASGRAGGAGMMRSRGSMDELRLDLPCLAALVLVGVGLRVAEGRRRREPSGDPQPRLGRRGTLRSLGGRFFNRPGPACRRDLLAVLGMATLATGMVAATTGSGGSRLVGTVPTPARPAGGGSAAGLPPADAHLSSEAAPLTEWSALTRIEARLAAERAAPGSPAPGASAAYQASLESEYELYAAVAGDAAGRARLLGAATAQGTPEASSAIVFNLGMVAAQLAQERAIREAEAGLTDLPPGGSERARLLQDAGRPALLPPLVGVLTQGFGPTDLAIEAPARHDHRFYPHFHTGLDIAAPYGTPVHAAAAGRVILTATSVDDQGHLVGYGNYVVIAHSGGMITLYGHLDSFAVRSGQSVGQGQLIGREGSTGNSTGPHVHFETRLHGGIVDPTPYLVRQPGG